MNDYLILLLGFVCAGIGGELFVAGTVGIAGATRISPAIIAATVAAFATSTPELTVSVTAALNGTPQIGLGDVLGSNVVNVALILGLGLLIAPIPAPRDIIRRDFPQAIAVPLLMAVLVRDGVISRLDGLLLLTLFAVWFISIAREAARQRGVKVASGYNPLRATFEVVAGLVVLIVAGRLIVDSATTIAESYGIAPFIIGATIVALGTSVPELATTIIAQIRGHTEVGLGTILGSNIFNTLFIVGIASNITPIHAKLTEVAPALVFGALSVVCVWPPRSGVIATKRGFLLLALYVCYLAATYAWH